MQRRIAGFLDRLRRLKAQPAGERQPLAAEGSGVPIVLDMKALSDAGIDIDEPTISFEGRDLPLGRLLDRILRDVSTVFVVEDDQIVITTADAADYRFSAAIYPLDRLLAKGRDMQRLTTMLQANVTPDTWEQVGGPAVLWAVGGDAPCLVASHTTAGHRAVAEFLGSLK